MIVMHGIRPFRFARTLMFVFAMVLVGVFTASCGDSEPEFPNRDIEWFVGFNAGGGFDVASRIIADKMSEDLGVNVVVRNIPGGGGRRAVQEISRGEPDGYSISIVNMPNQITAELLDPEGVDFNAISWIGRAVIQTYGMYVAESYPHSTPQEIAASSPEPRFCLTGLSGHSFLVAAIATKELGIPWNPVTGYQGSDIRAGQLRKECELASGPIAGDTLTAVNGPDFKVLWMFADERFDQVPDAPTISELGYSDVGGATLANNGLVMAPPGTPDSVLKILSDSLNKVLDNPEVIEAIHARGMAVSTLTPDTTGAAVKGMFSIVNENIDVVRERAASSN
jgi:tripartite-type tricarboxylate transporter receptor subunit TctC